MYNGHVYLRISKSKLVLEQAMYIELRKRYRLEELQFFGV